MKTSIRQLATLAFSLFVAGCSAEHTPSAPTAIAAPSNGSADLLGTAGSLLSSLRLVSGLQRSVPLAQPITVSQLIGREGGTLSIPAAGVTVVIPEGALTSETQVTMTARAGSLVAYDFAPHGITFSKPLVFTQSLRGTNATLLSAPLLKLGYYADERLLGRTGGVVSELLGGVLDLLSWSFTANIQHFSGYMVSCGRGLGE
jgi:ZU5 domain-containing protein